MSLSGIHLFFQRSFWPPHYPRVRWRSSFRRWDRVSFFRTLQPSSLSHNIIPVERVLILIEAFILAVYLYSRYRLKDQGEISVRLLVSGKFRSLFWGGIVFIGFVFPFTLEYIYSCCPDYPALLFTTGLFLLCGGFFLRLGVLASGVKEQIPMHKIIEIKANLRSIG